MSRLAVELRGQGPDLVLVHGWGMHSGVWDELAAKLENHFTLHLVDLPGHGASRCDGGGDIAAWADAVLEAVPAGADWAGWSLGGLVALQAGLRAPGHMKSLVLLAATPRFVRAADWPCGIDAGVLDLFARQLDEDYEKTLQRFLSLQVRGSEHLSQTLRRLRRRLASGRPSAAALRAGLGMLRESDFRTRLATFEPPLRLLLGERDTLVPAAVAGRLRRFPAHCIAGAGHAPFVSHPAACAAQLQQWLQPGAPEQAHG